MKRKSPKHLEGIECGMKRKTKTRKKERQ